MHAGRRGATAFGAISDRRVQLAGRTCGRAPPWVFPEPHARDGTGGYPRWHLRGAARRRSDACDDTLQRRTRGSRSALFGRPRRDVHRPEPGDQRILALERPGDPHHLGSHIGGAFFVVSPEIEEAGDLRGATIASPQLGNTQDVALRTWLADQGLATDVRGGGDVSVLPQANAQTLDTFRAGDIDGAWVPEPWATRLVQEGGGEVLVDERALWPQGRYVTTHLIVRTAYLEEHPDIVRALLRGVVEANAFVNEHSDEARVSVNEGIAEVAGKALGEDVLAAAWENLAFTYDPIATSLTKSAADATELGLLESTDLEGIYDLTLLNQVLAERGETQITDVP